MLKVIPIVLVFFILSFLGLHSSIAKEPLQCLKDIENIKLYTVYGYHALGKHMANAICEECEENTDRSECMLNKANENKSKYEDNLKNKLIKNAVYLSQGVEPTEQQLQQDFESFNAECPGMKWSKMLNWSKRGVDLTDDNSRKNLGRWLSTSSRCLKNLCSKNPEIKNESECLKAVDLNYLPISKHAINVYVTQSAVDALTGIDRISFEDDEVGLITLPKFSDEKKKKKWTPGYPPKKDRIKGIKKSDLGVYLDKSSIRPGEIEDTINQANRQQMGCPSNAKFSLPGPTCIRWRKDGVADKVVKQMEELVEGFVDKLLYKDIASFAAKQVWQSYSMALLMDPSVLQLSCDGGEASVEDRVRSKIGIDAYLQTSTTPKESHQILNKCFTEDLGLGDRVSDLSKTAAKMRCGDLNEAQGGSCSKDSPQNIYKAKEASKQNFKRRVKDLHLLKGRMEKLKNGELRVGIKKEKLTCNGFSSCDELFKKTEECVKSPSAGCIPPDYLRDDLRMAWQLYNNFNDTANHILSKTPELAVEITDWDEKKDKAVKRESWKTFDPNKLKDRTFNEKYEKAVEQSRKKKLGLVLDEICSDPKDFAKKMLQSNPGLISDYMKQSSSPDIGKLLCVGLSEVQAEKRSDAVWKGAALTATIALGAAAALPTGGASLAFALGAASSVGMTAITLNDISNAYQRMRLESGLLHGCVGDYQKAQKANEDLEDAMIRAAIDLGIGVTFFAGMGAIQKITELRRLGKVAKGIEGVDPQWLRAANRANNGFKKVSKIEKKLLASEYDLRSVEGLMRGRRLTRKGKKAVQAIHDLEKMGIPKSVIEKALRGCPL